MCRAFLEIFQNARNLSKSCSKVAQTENNQKLLFVTKVAQKLLEKNKNVFWSDAKMCKLYNKSKISKHFCAVLQKKIFIKRDDHKNTSRIDAKQITSLFLDFVKRLRILGLMIIIMIVIYNEFQWLGTSVVEIMVL